MSSARILLGMTSVTVNSEWECVNGKEKGIKYSSLRDAMRNWGWVRAEATDGPLQGLNQIN